MNAVLTSALFGVGLGFSFGPGVLRLIDLSLTGNISRSIAFAVGLIFTDIFYLVAVSFVIGSSLETHSITEHRGTFSLIAFVILTYFSVTTWRTAETKIVPLLNGTGNSNLFRDAATGFVMNLFNPFIPSFWWGAVSFFILNNGSLVRQNYFGAMTLFAVSCLGATFLSDLAKVFFFAHTGKLLRGRTDAIWMTRMRKGAAIVIFIFALRVLMEVRAGV